MHLEVSPHRSVVLANATEPQKLFVRLKLEAPEATRDLTHEVALFILVDTSGSMRTKLAGGTSKLERAIEAIASISELSSAGNTTKVGLAHFDSTADVLMPLRALDPEAGAELASQATRLRNFSGGTRLELALELIRDETSASNAVVKKVIVLTDGETTDTRECLSLVKSLASERVGLICIGLGADYNEDFLAQLADDTNGFLFHLSESEESLAGLRNALWDTLLAAEREQVTNARVSFELERGVILDGFQRVYPMVQVVRSSANGRYHIGNVAGGSEINLVAELTLPRHSPGRRRIAKVTTHYDVPGNRQSNLEVAQAMDIEYSIELDAARNLDQEVVFFVRQARMTAMADQAIVLARKGQIEGAQKSLKAFERLSRSVGNPELQRLARTAARELEKGRKMAPNTIKAFKVGAKTKTLMAPPTKNF